MARQDKYRIVSEFAQICHHFDLSKQALLRAAELPADTFDRPGGGITAEQYFRIWSALFTVSNDPELPMKIAKTYARVATIPACLAYSASRNIRDGIRRLAVFKTLIAPVNLLSEDTSDGFAMTVALQSGQSAQHGLAVFEIVYLTELMRNSVLPELDPVRVGIPGAARTTPQTRALLKCPVVESPQIEILLRSSDADLPLISANADLLEHVEPALEHELKARFGDAVTSARVKATLSDLLPAGHATIEAVCDALVMTRRSLQRRLKQEGNSFQELLNETREEMSMNFLRTGEMSVEEISFLLAYRDPNSFYRAFHGWTGMTPAEARRMALQ